MNYSKALEQMKLGERALRAGWNGKGMFIFIVTEWEFVTDVNGVDNLPLEPFICMKTAGDTLVPWVASQADQLADDWLLDDHLIF